MRGGPRSGSILVLTLTWKHIETAFQKLMLHKLRHLLDIHIISSLRFDLYHTCDVLFDPNPEGLGGGARDSLGSLLGGSLRPSLTIEHTGPKFTPALGT